MSKGLSDLEGRVLHGLVEEASGDIVVRLDASGFIVFASSNVSELGHDLSSMLVMPHVVDLAEREYEKGLSEFVEAALAGDVQRGWFEFPVKSCRCDGDCRSSDCRRWYALSLRPVDHEGDPSSGALGLLRSVQHTRSLEGELHSRSVTDPLTGLANRQTLCASLRRHLHADDGAVVAMFAVDRMRALFMQYGQRTADEIMWGFAKFLESMTLPDQELGQIDHERLAVISPGMEMTSARDWANEVLETFSQLTLPSTSRAPKLCASAGLAPADFSVDWTLRQAEIGLVMARAGGGMRVGESGFGTYRMASPVGVAANAR